MQHETKLHVETTLMLFINAAQLNFERNKGCHTYISLPVLPNMCLNARERLLHSKECNKQLVNGASKAPDVTDN